MSPTAKKKKAGPRTIKHAEVHGAHEPEQPEEEEGEELSVEERLEILEGDFAALKDKLLAHGIVF
jgi:hypothetical protein